MCTGGPALQTQPTESGPGFRVKLLLLFGVEGTAAELAGTDQSLYSRLSPYLVFNPSLKILS